MHDKNVGKKVDILIPGPKRIKRVLKEDYQGLYIDYKNETVRVRPELNEFGENNTNSYIVESK